MSSYNTRTDEFAKDLTTLQLQATATESASDPQVLASYVRLLTAWNAYVPTRDAAFAQGLSILRDDSGATGSTQQDRWKTLFRGVADEVMRTLPQSVADSPNARVKEFAVGTAQQESTFFAAIAQMPLATVQGDVQQYRKDFEAERSNLDSAWTDTSGRAVSVHDQARALTSEVLELQRRAIRAAIDSEGDLKAALGKIVSIASAARNAAGDKPPSYALPPLGATVIETLHVTMTTTDERAARAQQLFQSELSVTVMFTETREAVARFMEKTNLDLAQRQYADAVSASNSIAGRVPTSAQQRDAADFTSEAARAAKEVLDRFDSAYRAFVNQFREIFIGAAGDRTVETVANPERTRWGRDQAQSLNIQGELKKIYDNTSNVVEISIYGLDNDVRDAIRKHVSADVDLWRLALNKASDRSWSDAIRFLFVDYPIDKLKGIISSSRGGRE